MAIPERASLAGVARPDITQERSILTMSPLDVHLRQIAFSAAAISDLS